MAATDRVTSIFVHGVGMSPALFTPVSRLTGQRSYVWVRPGYGPEQAVATLDRQVEALNRLIKSFAPAIVIGVGGGASLGLASAISQADGLVGLVTHEPLVGSLVPALDQKVKESSQRLRRSPSRDAVSGFLQSLYGLAAWQRLAQADRDWGTDHYRTVSREAVHFAAFAPTMADLQAIEVVHLTTVGARSAPDRFEVAELLGSLGASTTMIDGAGHLPQFESPRTFSSVLTSFAGQLIRS